MAFKFKVQGFEIQCDTPQDAIALVQGLASEKSKSSSGKQSTSKPEAASAERPQSKTFDVTKETVKFLDTILESGKKGADGETLADVLNLKHPKGLGGRIALINKKIKQDGYDLDDVFMVRRGVNGDTRRRWFSGSRLEDYLHEIGYR